VAGAKAGVITTGTAGAPPDARKIAAGRAAAGPLVEAAPHRLMGDKFVRPDVY
jgi:hypothetical protein